MSLRSIPFAVNGTENTTLHGEIHFASEQKQHDVVIVLHGFRVHMSWGFYPALYARLVGAGFTVVAFNFTRNGFSEPSATIFESDRFAANTITKECDDARTVLSAVIGGELISGELGSVRRVFMLGHSRGAGIALLTATPHIAALALWSPLADFDRYSDRQKATWRARGYISAPASAAGPAFRMDVGYLDDIEKNQHKYSLTDVMATCEIPMSLVVGSNDLATPPSEAETLYAVSHKDRVELTIIPQSGHTFGTTDPYTGSTAAFETAIDLSVRLFNKYR